MQSLAELTAYSAVQLVMQGAGQIQPGCLIPVETRSSIVRICQHVAGIRLAGAGRRLDEPPRQTGLAMMPGPLMVVLVAPLAGRIAATRWHRILLVPGGLLFSLGTLLQLLRLTPTPQFLTVWLPGLLLTGIGVALVLPVLSSAAVQQLPPQKLAVGSGVSQAIRQFGSVLGVSLALAILGPAPATLAPFHNIYWLMIASGLSVSVLSLWLNTLGARTSAPRSLQPHDLPQPQIGFD